MRRLLAGICMLSACAGPGARGDSFGYAPPERTPYDARPLLKEQYLMAHRAAWNQRVSGISEENLEKALRGEEELSLGGFVACCEATPNVTRGWYRGWEDGQRFLAGVAVRPERAGEVLERVRRLKAEIASHPVEDWYVSDSYTPSAVVEVPEPGGTVIRSYRDATLTKLYEVRQVRDGSNHGRCETYDVNGSLRRVSRWVDGVLEGEEISYDDTGDVSGRATYRQGRLHGPELHFDENGSLSEYSEFEAGLQQGRQVGWGPDGNPDRYFLWKSGLKHGRCLFYQPEGVLVEVFEAGKRIGPTPDPVPAGDLPAEERPAALNRLREQFRR